MSAANDDNLLKHGSIMLAATLIGGFTGYLYHFLMIRFLTPAEYGIVYSLLALFMIIGVPISTISVVITKYVSNYKAAGHDKKVGLLFRKSLKVLSCLGLGVLGLFILFSGVIGNYLKIESVTPVFIVGMILSITFVSTATSGTLQGLQEFLLLGVFGIIGALAKVVFGVLFVILSFGANGALAGIFVSSIIGILITLIPLKGLFKYNKSEKTIIDKKEIYQYLVPVGIAIFCFGFLTYYDTIIVKHYFDPVVAGYYSTCALIGKAFLFPPIAFAGALFPKVSEKHALGEDPFPLLKKAFVMNIGVLLIGVIICLALPKFLINVLMKGKEIPLYYYEEMVVLMRVFGIMVIPYGLLNILIYYNLAMHRTKFLYILGAGVVSLIAVLVSFHSTLLEVVVLMGVVGYLLFFVNLAAIYFTKEVKGARVQREDIYINAGIQ